MTKVNVVILAAGEGKRMKSKHSKVTQKLLGKPMIKWVFDSFSELEINKCVVVVGHKSDEVVETLKDYKAYYVKQEEQLGTGHAVLQACPVIKDEDGVTFVFSGDVPMISSKTVCDMVEYHENNKCAVTVLSAEVDNPFNYGRLVKNEDGNLIKIVEEKDANADEKKIKEINSGIYCFNNSDLMFALSKLNNDNAQHEYYLTDTIEILINNGKKAKTYVTNDSSEILGINDRAQLAYAEDVLRKRIIAKHMKNGVTFVLPDTTVVEADVEIGRDTIIFPNTMLKGKTSIGEDCEIGPSSVIENSNIESGSKVISTFVEDSCLDENVKIGPFSHVRPGSNVGSNSKIGNFVEVKKSNLGEGTKAGHLTYIGDCDVGDNCNFGCGTILANYDGCNKYRSTIGNHVFIGCNSNIISPVKLGDNSYIAGGTTVVKDVPSEALTVSRAKQEIREGWVKCKDTWVPKKDI